MFAALKRSRIYILFCSLSRVSAQNYGYLNIDGHGHIRVLAQTVLVGIFSYIIIRIQYCLIMSITAIRTADESDIAD